MRPGLGKLREQPQQLGAFGPAQRSECSARLIALLPAHAMHKLQAGVGEANSGAACIVRVYLAHGVPVLHSLLHEARCSRLVDANVVCELADRQRFGGVCERAE
ncbi:hypothetical protein GCM10020360_22930 [Nonlabens tegetincola]